MVGKKLVIEEVRFIEELFLVLGFFWGIYLFVYIDWVFIMY